MRILSVAILLAALIGVPLAAQGQDYSDPSIATPLSEQGYYAEPQPAVTEAAQPGATTPGARPRPRPNGIEPSPSDAPDPRPPMPPVDPIQKGGLVERLEAAERQIDAIQKHVLDGGKGACCDTCCDQTMSYAGLEIVALKVFATEDQYGNNDYQPGARIWAGYQRADGLGLRIRWFDYTQDIGGDVVDIENLDLEITDAFSLGRWDGMVSGGLRYGEFRDDNGDVETYATGPTVGIQMNRELNGRRSLFVALQESLLYGNDIIGGWDDTLFSITEIQIGVQADRCLNGGATAFFRTGVEGQYYSGVGGADTQDIGLFGIFATVGLMR